jgi:hypothetical protein
MPNSPRKSLRPWLAKVLRGAFLLLPIALPWQCRMDDIAVYWRWAQAFAQGARPYLDFPVEYPPLALMAVMVPTFGAWTLGTYAWHYVVFLWLLDGVQRQWSMPSWAQSITHLGFFTALEALLYVTCYRRLDLFAVIAVSFGLAVFIRQPHSFKAWSLMAVATGIKLYPIVLWPPMAVYAWRQGVGYRRLAQQLGLFFFLASALLAAPCLWSPESGLDWLRYHQHRGLQAASNYVALHVMAGHFQQPIVTAFRYGAVEVAEPWATEMLRWANVATPAAWLITLVATLPRLRTGLGLYRVALALVLALLLTAKVLSPQYALWLVPLTVAAIGPKGRLDLPLGGLVFGICLTTSMLYPGETLMLNGQAKRQIALIARGFCMALAWGWLLIRPERSPPKGTGPSVLTPKPSTIHPCPDPWQHAGAPP